MIDPEFDDRHRHWNYRITKPCFDEILKLVSSRATYPIVEIERLNTKLISKEYFEESFRKDKVNEVRS